MGLTCKTLINLQDIGDYVWCKYVGTPSAVGTFSDLGTKIDTDVASSLISTAGSVSAPSGYFKFIASGYTVEGDIICVADRVIQTGISYPTMYIKGVNTGYKTTIDSYSTYQFNIRLLSGGSTSAFTEDLYEKIIVNSTLNGNITAGDSSVWNWSVGTIVTSSPSGSESSKMYLGGTTINAMTSITYAATATTYGFRPMMIIKLPVNKRYLLKNNNQYYTLNSSQYDTTNKKFIALTLNGGTEPNKTDIENYGFINISLLTNTMIIGTESFKPINKFDNSTQLKLYKII